MPTTDRPAATPQLGPFEVLLPPQDDARAVFEERRALVCLDVLDHDLLGKLIALCDRAAFMSDQVEGLGHRAVERPPLASTAILLALRRPDLFRWLEAVTGCAPIASVEGQVVQTWPQAGDELVWHDDMNYGQRRRLGVTIGLGSEDYEGGLFEMRSVPDGGPLMTFKHDRPGTALIFEVSACCEHRVHPLTKGGPRRVFTGWFIG